MDNSACAIVGIGCRYPGGIDSPDTFWDSLVNTRDCITSIPENRWSLDKFYSANKNQKNRLQKKAHLEIFLRSMSDQLQKVLNLHHHDFDCKELLLKEME